jgi:RNA polymerase sigma factor (sigma-70 family)
VQADDDSTLVARCSAGDAAAWRQLVQRYQRLVHAIVRRGGLDEHHAADVFQTVFTRLVQALPKLTEPDRLQAWIVTTAKRELWLQVQRSRRQVSLTPDDRESSGPADAIDPADPALQPDQTLDHLQQVWRVREGLQALDERCRDLLTLVFRDDDDRLGYDEVARRLGLPVGSIGPTRLRCLDKLRRLLERRR